MKTRSLLLGLFVLGCGGSSSKSAAVGGSCRIDAAHTCEDFDAAASASAKQACAGSGVWSDGACDHSGAGGGCRESSSGVSATVWYYQTSADTVRQSCMLAGGAFVDGEGATTSSGGTSGGGSDMGQACAMGGASCNAFSDCCSGTCNNHVCAAVPSCQSLGDACTLADDCCSGSCSNGLCADSGLTGCRTLYSCIIDAKECDATCQSECRSKATPSATALYDAYWSCAFAACEKLGNCSSGSDSTSQCACPSNGPPYVVECSLAPGCAACASQFAACTNDGY